MASKRKSHIRRSPPGRKKVHFVFKARRNVCGEKRCPRQMGGRGTTEVPKAGPEAWPREDGLRRV